MASDRITYKVFINERLDRYAKSFSFNIKKKPIQIELSEGHAIIILERTTKYKPEDIAKGKYEVFSEAMKKILLAHILLYSKCINISTISVMVKDRISVFNINKSDMKSISSLIRNQLEPPLNEHWKEKELIEAIIDNNKKEKIQECQHYLLLFCQEIVNQ